MRRKSARASQYNQLGVTFFQSGAVDLAVEQFTRATKRAPWVSTYWLNLGVALIERNELERAEAALTHALELNAFSQSAYFHLAQLHSKRGEEKAAKAAYEKAIELNPASYLARRARELIEGWRPNLAWRSDAEQSEGEK